MSTPQTDVEIRVRYSECDAQRVAHHAAYVVWLEIARTELLRKFGVAYRDLEDKGVFFVVTAVDIRYRSPARYDDVITVHVRETRRTRVRIDHEYRIMRNGVELAAATTTIACVDASGKPTAIPPGALG